MTTLAMGGRPAVTSRLALAIVLAVLAVAAAGAALAAAGLTRPGGSRPGHVIGDDVTTSFGVVAVEFVRTVDGLNHRQLSGATHGVNGLVDAGHAQIQTAVAITNRTVRPMRYRSSAFTLLVTRDGRTQRRALTGGDLPDMRIQPDAGIEGHLDFTVPLTPARLALEFVDPGSRSPIVIDLGTPDLTGSGAPTTHAGH